MKLELTKLEPAPIFKKDLLRLAKDGTDYSKDDREILAGLLRFALAYLEEEGFNAQPNEARMYQALARFALDWKTENDQEQAEKGNWSGLMDNQEQAEIAAADQEEGDRRKKEAAVAAARLAKSITKRHRLAKREPSPGMPHIRWRKFLPVIVGGSTLALAIVLLRPSAKEETDSIRVLPSPAKAAATKKAAAATKQQQPRIPGQPVFVE